MVLRKAHGLGAQGMVGGSFHLPMFTVAWPTGEFGPMNLEGSVKLGFRKELKAINDPAQRKARFDEMVAEAYERGKALSTATLFEIDDVIDPAATRAWVMAGLRSMPAPAPRTGKKRAFVDTWCAEIKLRRGARVGRSTDDQRTSRGLRTARPPRLSTCV